MFRFDTLFRFLLAALILSGCAAPATTVTLGQKAISLKAQESLEFRQVSVSELAMNRPPKDGKLVTFEASFDRTSFSSRYGETKFGYKLWDRQGNWVLCENIYTLSSLWDELEGLDTSKDFNEATKGWILNYGTFVRIEGAYHAGNEREPARVDVYFIDGKPVKEVVNQ